MGCSASKSPVDGTSNQSPVKTIEVNSAENGGSRDEKPSSKVDLNTKKFSIHKSKGDETAVSKETRNGDEEAPGESTSLQLEFVKRMENDEEAKNDVTFLNEIVNNSISKNAKEFIRVLASVSYEHRQRVRCEYKERYSEDLLDRIVVGNDDLTFETGLKSIVRNQAEFLSYFLHQSVKKRDYKTLVEILTAWPCDLLTEAKNKYKEERRVEFLEDIINSLSDKMPEEERSLLISVSSLERNGESKELDEGLLNEECNELSQGAKSIADIVTAKPYNLKQLRSIFEQFKSKYYLDIIESIEIEFTDEHLEMLLKTIVGIANDASQYFAVQLREIFSKQSVDKDRLLFMLIGRQPIDLSEIVKRYEELSKSILTDELNSHLNNHLRDLLIFITQRSRTK